MGRTGVDDVPVIRTTPSPPTQTRRLVGARSEVVGIATHLRLDASHPPSERTSPPEVPDRPPANPRRSEKTETRAPRQLPQRIQGIPIPPPRKNCATSKSVSEGDSTRDFPIPSFTLRVSNTGLKQSLGTVCNRPHSEDKPRDGSPCLWDTKRDYRREADFCFSNYFPITR